MRKFMLVIALAGAAACGGDGDGGGGSGLTPEAQAVVNYVIGESQEAVSFVQHVSQALTFALIDPVGAAAAGIGFAPGATPGTFDFDIPIDTDGDGNADATAAGSTTLDQIPVIGPNLGLGGTIDGTLLLASGRSISVTGAFEVTAQGLEVSGDISFSDPSTGHSGNITIPDTAPMLVRPAGDGAVANLCAASAQGSASVDVIKEPPGPGGGSIYYFEAVLQFLFSSATAQLTGASGGTNPTALDPLPDTSAEVACDFSISDWVGTFEMFWFCPPGGGDFESHTFTVTGPNTVQVSKLGTGQTTPTVFTATAIPGNPHVLVGEFTEGDPLYTETFRYTLSPDGSFFTQDNVYVIIEGPFTGDGGPCYGTGYRQ
jgi:hypothetical protein